MTAKELAGILSGREYGGEIYPLEERNSQAAGLVVVYGYSDDNVEFRGAIDDEVGAYKGTTIHINKSGILHAPTPDCDMDECPYLKQAVKEARSIRAVWHDEGSSCWTFETGIPHETFDIYEDGELFCVGIVFALDDIQAKTLNVPLTLDELREMDGELVWWWKPKRKAIASICIFNGVMSDPLFLSYDFIEDIVNLETYQYLIDRGYKPYLRNPDEKRKDTDG